jgi:HD-GYP domain-containing protein (c-di-GMP phosphodiesterase class II)
MKCGLNGSELENLRAAARLHDIGKIGIPDHILLKPGKFESDEWEIMKTHSELGELICQSIDHPSAESVAEIVRHHHEFFNGSGYPDGLSGENIPISSRIISIADAYDAMITTRPYHNARTHSQVMEILEEDSGKRIDSKVYMYFQPIIERSQKLNLSYI